MLIETAAKTVCSVLGSLIQSVLKKTGMEEQNGFATNRGCMDGIFFDQSGTSKVRRAWFRHVGSVCGSDKGV
jgi:hypothetical protein